MTDVSQLSTGVEGLDELLRGGFVPGRMYLVHGRPGTGKTLLGLHFLEAGLAAGETVLMIHGEESREEIEANAAALSIDIEGAEFLDLGPESDFFAEDRSYDLVEASELDHERHTRDIYATIEEIDPSRVVIDPITQLRYLETSDYQFRKRILSFMRFLKERNTTVLATATLSETREYDREVRSLSDGIVELNRGEGGRRISVTKHRGFGQRDGDHGLEIRDGGLEVFPALVPEGTGRSLADAPLTSGIEELDSLLGGGLTPGTVTFVTGPAGSGKTTLSSLFLCGAAHDGQTVGVFLFEEDAATYRHRMDAIGLPIETLRDQGRFLVEDVEPLARSPEEFGHRITSLHEQLLVDGRSDGDDPLPGQYRPGYAVIEEESPSGLGTRIRFVPPKPDGVERLMDDLERFVQQGSDWPTLVDIAITHYQFETIHPFKDGNGRVGRLLIVLMLVASGLLHYPMLYLSSYIERHRTEYADRLLAVSEAGAWDEWLRFFVRGIREQAEEAFVRARLLVDKRAAYERRYADAANSIRQLALTLFEDPYFTVREASDRIGVVYQTANNAVDELRDDGVVEEITGNEQNRVFRAAEIMDIVERPANTLPEPDALVDIEQAWTLPER